MYRSNLPAVCTLSSGSSLSIELNEGVDNNRPSVIVKLEGSSDSVKKITQQLA